VRLWRSLEQRLLNHPRGRLRPNSTRSSARVNARWRKEVAGRREASPARVALSWLLGRPAVSSVIVAARAILGQMALLLGIAYVFVTHLQH